jgi:hypothetical protein
MCFCWCVTEINYRMYGVTIKVAFLYINISVFMLTETDPVDFGLRNHEFVIAWNKFLLRNIDPNLMHFVHIP